MKKYIFTSIILFFASSSFASPLFDAIGSNDKAAVIASIKSGADLNKRIEKYSTFKNISPLVWAIKAKNIEAFKELLAAGANPDSLGGSFDSPAFIQIPSTSSLSTDIMLEMLKLLVEKKANVNALSNDGSNALHAAAYSGRPEVIKYLISVGVDKSAKDSSGQTPYALAKIFQSKEIAELLK